MKKTKPLFAFFTLLSFFACGPEDANFTQKQPPKSFEIPSNSLKFNGGLESNEIIFHEDLIGKILKGSKIIGRAEQVKVFLIIDSKNYDYKSFVLRKADHTALDLAFIENELETKYKYILKDLSDARIKNFLVNWCIFVKIENKLFEYYFDNNIIAGFDTGIEERNFEEYAKHKLNYFKIQSAKLLDINGDFLD